MSIIREIIYGAARHGANLTRLLEACGLDQEQINKAENYLDFEQASNVWLQSVRLTGDDLLGLHLGERVTPTIIGLTGHLMQTSSTLRVALENVCKFNALFTDMFSYTLSINSGLTYFGIEPSQGWITRFPETAKQARDQAASGVLSVCKLLTGKPVIPQKVLFREKRAKRFLEYEEVLRCPVIFNAKENAVVFSNHILEEIVVSHDAGLFSTFFDILQKQQAQSASANSFKLEVSQTLERVFGLQPPSLHEMADQLGISPRTFQRKLAEESTTYRQLVDAHRRKFASAFLTEDQSKIKTIASLLGYSDTSAFRRAFRKWTDESPKNFRKRKFN